MSWLIVILLTSACGRPQHSPAPAPRVVSLAPALTAIIVALEKEAHLVGITRFCEADGVTVVADLRPSPTRVMAQEPDLVVIGGFASQTEAREALVAAGLPVMVLPHDSLTEIRQATLALGQRLGADDAAGRLVAQLDAALEAARAGAALRRPLKVLLVFDIQQGFVFTTGGGDHLAELIDAVGAINVAAGGPLTTRLSLSRVIALGPDVILHVAPNARFKTDADSRTFWATLEDVPAVKRDAVFVWPDDTLAQTGPAVPVALQRLGALLDRVAAKP